MTADPPIPTEPPAPRKAFGRSRRLTRDLEYQAVYNAKARKSAGPLTVFGAPNGLAHPRLGLAVGRRVGGAVARNRIKRLLREAFRLEQHALPAGLDLVIRVHPHPMLGLDGYRQLLVRLALEVNRVIERRQRRDAAADEPQP